MEIGAGSGVIEFSEQAAELRATASGRKAAAFREEIEFGDARGALVADDLDYAGHGVRAIESALSAMNEFDLVNVIEGEVGKVHVAAGKIDGSAVNEDFCETGIAAVDEDGGQAADGAGAGETDTGLRGEKIGERDGLALVDFLAND